MPPQLTPKPCNKSQVYSKQETHEDPFDISQYLIIHRQKLNMEMYHLFRKKVQRKYLWIFHEY